MAKQNPTLYSISKTFIWFAIVSLVLTGSLVAIVMTDYKREWKDYQKKFVQLKLKKAQDELKTADQAIDKAKLDTLTQEHAAAVETFKKNKSQYESLKKEIAALDTRITKAKDRYQTEKQHLDSYKYFSEEYAVHHDKRAAGYQKRVAQTEPKVAAAKVAYEDLERLREEKDKALQAFLSEEKTAQKQIDKAVFDSTLIKRRIEAIKPTLAKDILNAPMLDFVAPTLKVQQIVLDNLYDDYHFAKTQKVDRCTTCHLGIDQKGFEDAPQPFRTHPKIELYLGSSSPHPIEKIGCTVCHGGNGHSVSFKDSAHTPGNEDQRKDWEKRLQWRELEKWESKMLPTHHIQASCTKCHTNVVEIPQADKLNKGRDLAMQSGCLDCHKVGQIQDVWKVGPGLENVKSKVSADWMVRWLQDPKSFRESSKMPSVFHLSNTSSPEDRERNNASIQAITAYLMKNSQTVELTKPTATGNSANGEKLVKEVGCLGCHTAADVEAGHFAPELSGLGSKTTPEWMYTWLKDPKHYNKATRMPNLRLTDQEASDITAYLLSLKNEKFESLPVPPAKPGVVDELILSSLQSTLRQKEAQAELAKMSTDDKMQFLGKKAILHQGCFSCHDIKGFEDAKPIGTELTNEGQKDIHQLDFGFVHIDHTRQAFISQKIKEPRIYDKGKNKGYYEKLRMPQFTFSDEEIEALTTFVLSLTEEQIPLEMQKRLNLKEMDIEKGRTLVAKLNCTGCHSMDGKPGLLRDMSEQGSGPPNLEGEGAKVQEKWLHDFLAHPTPIRPWLTYRMPTFGFTEDELGVLIRYFDNLSGEEVSVTGYAAPLTTPENMAGGKLLFEKLQCAKCHEINANSAAMGTSFLAPDLAMTKNRLKPDWVHDWILSPQKLDPGTMMPDFFPDGETALPDVLGGNTETQITAIRDYLYQYQGKTPAKTKENAEEPAKNPVAK